jgi:cation-transporting P-type ATPase C
MKHTVLPKIELCHQLPGRLRLRLVPHRPYTGEMERIERSLRGLRHVLSADARAWSGSIVVRFHPSGISPDRLFSDVAERIRDVSPEPGAESGRELSRPFAPVRSGSRGLAKGPLLSVVGLGFFLSVAFVRRHIAGAPLSQRPFGPAGTAAIIGTIPLLRRAWIDLRLKRRVGIYPFLAASSLLAVGSGAAFTALEILFLLALGMVLEDYVTDRARRALREVLEIAPQTAFVWRDGTEIETPIAEIEAGDQVVVRGGDLVPVDGAVLEGEVLVDESNITGRRQPALHIEGEPVYAGTRVVQGHGRVRADRVGNDTYLAHVLALVESSLAERTEAEQQADVLASRLIRIGGVATAATFVLTGSLPRSLAVLLVTACPCATVLAAATAVNAAVANAAGRQILIKGGPHLERLARIDCVCFDKTGTLTSGVPRVADIVGRAPGQDTDRILTLAASAESGSEHPAARALVEEAGNRGLYPPAAGEREMHLGRGVRATVKGDTVLVGNWAFLEAEGVNPSYFRKRAAEHTDRGRSVLFVARNDKLQGMIVLEARLSDDLPELLSDLRSENISHLSVISGDSESAVRSLAERLGFDDWAAELLPGRKADHVARLEAEGRRVLMVGDGLNDTPALARADVGVAVGAGGYRAALEAADIALAGDDLNGLLFLRRLSRQTMKVVNQNFWIANVTNFGGIAFGMTGILSPVTSSALHVAHALVIMFNSGRLLSWRPAGGVTVGRETEALPPPEASSTS